MNVLCLFHMYCMYVCIYTCCLLITDFFDVQTGVTKDETESSSIGKLLLNCVPISYLCFIVAHYIEILYIRRIQFCV